MKLYAIVCVRRDEFMGWWHNIQGLSDPSKLLLVKKILAGLKKEAPSTKQAAPIRYPKLLKLLQALPSWPRDRN